MDRPECFVITAIGKRGSPERETADRHFEIIRRAAEAAGLDAVRMDRVDTEELRNTMSRKLKTARIVVADLTNANANAAYELGWFVLASVDDSAYADADDVSGDIVLEENQTVYHDTTGDVLLSVRIDRFHSDVSTTTGALDSNADNDREIVTTGNLAGRPQIVARWYDALDRLKDEVVYGTNGSSTFTYPGSPPSRSNSVQRTTYT